MGLNLLGVVTIPLPSLFADVDVRGNALPSAVKAYAAGLTFALAASPCSTPVLATLLGYVASTGDPARGASLLLAYTRRVARRGAPACPACAHGRALSLTRAHACSAPLRVRAAAATWRRCWLPRRRRAR